MAIKWIDTPIGLRVAETPITQAQWIEVMGTGTEPERLWEVRGADIPATHFTWGQAVEFAEQVGGRLPTNDEFLQLALAGAEAMPPNIADYAVCEQAAIQPVRTKRPNAWGLYDMAGLVWEWCADGPNERTRYLRGGSWSLGRDLVRAVSRNYYHPHNRNLGFGLRVVVWCGPPSGLERLAELEAQRDEARAERDVLAEQLDAARADLARYVAGIDAERESGKQVLTRLIRLVEEWERADCVSNTYECAEQVRAILRGDAPMGWESKEGGEA